MELVKLVKDVPTPYKFNDISETSGIHPVTAGKCAEKGKKLIDNYEGVWDI